MLGVSIIPPYETYVLYEVYVTPGLAVMIQLFNGMQSSLSMVYDREVGSMRVLLTSPYPRWSLLFAKLAAGVLVSLVQVYVFLAIARFWEVDIPWLGYLSALPAFMLSGLMLGAIGLFLSSLVRQLENFASVMNFVIFPMFFASSALYPLWRIRESSEMLYLICLANPFTHAVELVRNALYVTFEPVSFAVVLFVTIAFFVAAVARLRSRARDHGPARRPAGRSLMIRHVCLAALAIAAIGAGPLAAQPKPDPDWPCVQRKVPTIAAGTIWSGPSLDEAGPWGSDFEAAALAQKLSSRRTPLADIDGLVDAFARDAGPERTKRLTRVFAGSLEIVNSERQKIMSGIERYARGQRGSPNASATPPTRFQR